ncbi:MAG: VanW family protein [Tumebacillaceae bacterium]
MRQKRKKKGTMRWLGILGGCGVLAFGAAYWISDRMIDRHTEVQTATTQTVQQPPTHVQQPAPDPNQPPRSGKPIVRDPSELATPDEQLAQSKNVAKRKSKARVDAYLASLKTAQGQLVGTFSTSLAGHDASGRVQNIKLASQKIDGMILLPGGTFSFNDTTGDSNDPKAGWQLATVIVGKEFTDGYGGGICQVSSTLYNSVLKAGLQVKERYTHSLPVGYVPAGHDATVSYPELDFRFVNSYDVPVRIGAQIEGGNVVCKIFKLPPMPDEEA